MSKQEITDDEIRELIRQGVGRRKVIRDYVVGSGRFERIKREMTRKGVDYEHELAREMPDGYKLKGVSDMRTNPEGKPVWYKFDEDRNRQMEIMRAAVESMAMEVLPAKKVRYGGQDNDALCNLYTIADAHFGALAWHKENLEADWDLSEAERVILGCFQAMIDSAPAASTCVINQLGDLLHHDGLLPQTPTSGHILSSDGRFGKMVDIVIRVIRQVVAMALEKHQRVHLVMAEGNHDIASSIWLRKMFHTLYEQEPRIEVDTSEFPYYVYQHGDTLLAFHHGHLKKNDSLPLLFASHFPVEWGDTTKRYCHTGHRHHFESKEHSGMTVTQHPTLAAKDEYASRHGYASSRAAICHTYHARHGLTASNHVTPEMLEG